MSDRLPYLATRVAIPYEGLAPIPVSVLLENVRSLYNVGSFFRARSSASWKVIVIGGQPIFANGTCIGGIGVSGASGEQDDSIAQAAIAAFAKRVTA